jgi:predicted O-methyltransferase YrrM
MRTILDQIIPEVAVPTPECPQPHLWMCYDQEATEVEVLKLLYALVLATKPRVIVETGSYRGAGTVWLARAAKHNEFGKVHSCEVDENVLAEAKILLEHEQLDKYVELSSEPGLALIARLPRIDFAFLDSAIDGRVEEAQMVLAKLSPAGVIAVHDSNTFHAKMRNGPRPGLHELAEREKLQILQLDTPRGLTLLKKSSSQPSSSHTKGAL